MQPRRRRTIGHLITGLTWFLVILHLIPIVWMVYCGLKDNQEILSGKVMPGRRRNEVVFLRQRADRYLAGTADGGVTLFAKDGLRKVRHLELGTFATTFLLDGKSLWALSSNRGLQEIDPERLEVRRTFGVEAIAAAYGKEWTTLWVNEVAGSSLVRAGDTLFLSYRIKGYPGVTAFLPSSGTFAPMPGFATDVSSTVRDLALSPDGRLLALTSKGIRVRAAKAGESDRELGTGSLPALPDLMCALDARRLLLSADSRAYLYDLEADSVLNWLDREPGSGIVTAFARSRGRIWLGDSRGATALPDRQEPGKAAEGEPGEKLPFQDTVLFRLRTSSTAGASDAMDSRRVTAILPLPGGGTLLGGTGGALTLLDPSGAVLASATAPLPSIYIHWRNYVDLWRNIDFGLYLKNSFIVCLGVMVIAMILASMGGYALARYNFPGKNMFGYSVLATQMVPGIMLLLPLYLMFINFSRATGLIVKGTYGGLILTYAAYFVPFSIWILRGFFASLPKELEEAALVDGCGPIQAFFRIIIPSALPGIIATGVYVFLSAWDELMFAWVLTDEKTYTIPVGIRLFVGNFQNRYDLMMAAATVSTIPVMILFFLMQKHIVSGLTAGAVKG